MTFFYVNITLTKLTLLLKAISSLDMKKRYIKDRKLNLMIRINSKYGLPITIFTGGNDGTQS